MSDAHPSLLRSYLYKQTATYYFIEAVIMKYLQNIRQKSLEHENKVTITLTLLH